MKGPSLLLVLPLPLLAVACASLIGFPDVPDPADASADGMTADDAKMSHGDDAEGRDGDDAEAGNGDDTKTDDAYASGPDVDLPDADGSVAVPESGGHDGMASCQVAADCSGGKFCWLGACVVVTKIATSYGQSCALLSSGAMQCWGSNSDGTLGNASETDSPVPVAVTGLSSGVAAMAVGETFACALTTSGGVQCWGNNGFGTLGNGSMTSSSVPVPVPALSSGVAAISAGDAHACALTKAGGVQCWGYGGNGELGNGGTANSPVPVAVTGLASGVAAISAGGSHTCAVTTAGGLQCWGYGMDGQLGNSSTTNSPVPVTVKVVVNNGGPPQVLSLSGVAAVAAGENHTCALLTTGAVECWGDDVDGDLGDGATTQSNLGQGTVSGLAASASAIAAGYDLTCALLTSGAVQCWGDNVYGGLGNNTTTNSGTPVSVTGLGSSAAAIAASGALHGCALLKSGTVQCWGYNHYGQLGNNTTTNSSVPVTVMEP